MSDELINNLRAIANGAGSTTEPWHVMAGQAADRIEELKAENERLRNGIKICRTINLQVAQQRTSEQIESIAREIADFRKAVDESIEKDQHND
jgi:hypothetical protein